jgi:hypothetical protein
MLRNLLRPRLLVLALNGGLRREAGGRGSGAGSITANWGLSAHTPAPPPCARAAWDPYAFHLRIGTEASTAAWLPSGREGEACTARAARGRMGLPHLQSVM